MKKVVAVTALVWIVAAALTGADAGRGAPASPGGPDKARPTAADVGRGLLASSGGLDKARPTAATAFPDAQSGSGAGEQCHEN